MHAPGGLLCTRLQLIDCNDSAAAVSLSRGDPSVQLCTVNIPKQLCLPGVGLMLGSALTCQRRQAEVLAEPYWRASPASD